MNISELYNLNKSQAELDFINIDPERDIPLFLDPFFLSIRSDNWSIHATHTIASFFQQVIDLIREDNLNDGRLLFRHLHEPNSTCLGMSRGNPAGRGVGTENTDDIFDSLVQSRAVQTGLIEDIEDNMLFVDGFGKDKLSDMTTNIIRRHLIDYTINQCNLHNIPLQNGIPSGFYWNRATLQWEQDYCQGLVINNRKILLVPKGVVSFCKDYTPEKYYEKFVLTFQQNEHKSLNSALVQHRQNGNRYVTKKSLKAQNDYSKNFLAEFTRRNPQVLQDFKARTKTASLNNNDISDINLQDVANHLIRRLGEIPPGNANATAYHRAITGILELLFYPYLISPVKEAEIHEGRKRIDIVFDNAADNGIFHRFSHNMGLPCPFIFVECKNYSDDPVNPELDQLAGRYSPNRGKVGFLLCQSFTNVDLFIDRCKDTYGDDRGLIIPLEDNDIITLLQHYNNWNFIDAFLSDRVRRIMLA